jgi:hypothetical protein
LRPEISSHDPYGNRCIFSLCLRMRNAMVVQFLKTSFELDCVSLRAQALLAMNLIEWSQPYGTTGDEPFF